VAYELGDWDFVPGRARRGLRPHSLRGIKRPQCGLTFLHILVHCKMGLSYSTLSAVARNSDRLFDPTRITGERFAISELFSLSFPSFVYHEQNVCTYRRLLKSLTLRRRIKSHLLFAGIIRSSPFSPR